MSFTRALAKRLSSKVAPRQPAPSDGFGLAISPGGGRVLGTGVGLDHVVRSPVGGPAAVIRNVPSSPPTPPMPPMSPLRAVSSFNFFPQENGQTTPVRPTLPRLAIPQRTSSHGGRDSVITEFAEDGEDGPGSAQIWRPPNTDPQSASTYYVADKWGNWVLREQREVTPHETIAELATPISKTAEERAREEERLVEESAAVKQLRYHSSPNIPEDETVSSKRESVVRGERPTIRLVTPESGRLPINSRVRNSVYSKNNLLSLPQQAAPGPENRIGQSSSSGDAQSRGDGSVKGTKGKQRKSDGTRRPPSAATTIMSQDSTTTTIVDSPVDDMIDAVLQSIPRPSRQSSLQNEQGDLSPVIESPGRSPVQYPAIPRSQSIVVNKRRSYAAPPRPLPNPVLANIKRGAVEPPKDSPTLGLIEPNRPGLRSASSSTGTTTTTTASQSQSIRKGTPNSQSSQSNWNPVGSRTASPLNTHARKPSDRALLPSQTRMSSYDAYNDPSSTTRTGRPMPTRRYAYTSQQQQSPPPPGQAYGSPSQSPYTPSPPSASEPFYSSAITSPASHYPSTSTGTNPSMNSALLAKRLGAERAAEFQRIEQQQQRFKQEQEKWSRQNAWQAGGERYVEMPALPATPGWKPQLTPKRKGDDLFLSVK